MKEIEKIPCAWVNVRLRTYVEGKSTLQVLLILLYLDLLYSAQEKQGAPTGTTAWENVRLLTFIYGQFTLHVLSML